MNIKDMADRNILKNQNSFNFNNTVFIKIVTCIPKKLLKPLMKSLNEIITPIYPHYDFVYSFYPVKGTWRSLHGSSPYKGEPNKIVRANEIKLEFTIYRSECKQVIQLIREIHPYEEPVVEIFPLTTGKQILENNV